MKKSVTAKFYPLCFNLFITQYNDLGMYVMRDGVLKVLM